MSKSDDVMQMIRLYFIWNTFGILSSRPQHRRLQTLFDKRDGGVVQNEESIAGQKDSG
jgi:hypothetical protein